jgi:hypothetical protein
MRFFRHQYRPDGSSAPTGKSTWTDYVHVMQFEGGKIGHMTKSGMQAWPSEKLGWT